MKRFMRVEIALLIVVLHGIFGCYGIRDYPQVVLAEYYPQQGAVIEILSQHDTVCIQIDGDLTVCKRNEFEFEFPLLKPGYRHLLVCGFNEGVWGESCSLCSPRMGIKVLENTFTASFSWQEIASFQTLPTGLEISMSLETGKKFARIPPSFPLNLIFKPDFENYGGFKVDIFRNVPPHFSIVEFLNSSFWIKDPSCVDTRLNNVSSLQLFHMSRLQYYWQISINSNCPCAGKTPCRSELNTLTNCISNSGYMFSKSQLETVCIMPRNDLVRCSLKCSGFRDSLPNVRTTSFLKDSVLHSTKTLTAIPVRSLSSQCQYCGFENDTVLLFASSNKVKERFENKKILLGQSRFSPYFGYPAGGRTYGKVVSRRFSCSRIFEQALIVSVWSIHNLYHLLSDLLIPFSSMSQEPTVLFINIGHTEERSKFWQLMHLANTADSNLGLLRNQFFEIHSYQSLSDGITCFKHLYIECDISTTPQYFAFSNPTTKAVMSRNHYNGTTGFLSRLEFQSVVPSNINITIIKRMGTRRFASISKLRETLVAATPIGTKIKDVVVERLGFSSQLKLFASTTILICAHGQGCANSVFLRPGSTLILIMPQGWNGWKWMYANLAISAGVRVVVHKWSTHVEEDEGWNHTDSDYEDCDMYGIHPIRDQVIDLNHEVFKETINEAILNINFKYP